VVFTPSILPPNRETAWRVSQSILDYVRRNENLVRLDPGACIDQELLPFFLIDDDAHPIQAFQCRQEDFLALSVVEHPKLGCLPVRLITNNHLLYS